MEVLVQPRRLATPHSCSYGHIMRPFILCRCRLYTCLNKHVKPPVPYPLPLPIPVPPLPAPPRLKMESGLKGRELASQPASQLASQPANQPASQPASQIASELVSQSTNQPASQPAIQPASQPAIQPASQPTPRVTGEAIHKWCMWWPEQDEAIVPADQDKETVTQRCRQC
ncbi:putative hemoglobin and hemoglobin-haptoglobin-binding protein 3 [Portunus trituberculatus]|uniref:Putative hemoglobin and hemoglobin-haptoglobin-binding protein 3 n=1 Tax=Portunus trituberculatus TaxID=210409 RepID=A0A5B7GRV2_PORTR|nr:putative hemoglobin and hemoglobin-haptoglobin-binding protein 3 [Portunus trituberculatus]